MASSTAFEQENLNRKLHARHMRMIAIGGSIGVGFFYGSADATTLAGPSLIVAYLVCGLMIFLVCRALGEMSVEEPVAGGIVSYSSRYLHPFVACFIGWGALFNAFAYSGSEFAAVGKYVQYWFPQVPIWVTGLVIVALLAVINLVSVAIYGEVEFWMSGVKVATIIAMIVAGLFIAFTGIGSPTGGPLGFSNLVDNGGFLPNGIMGLALSLVLVTFSYGGTDNIAATAGEAEDVERTMPKAINGLVWRIVLFYVGGTMVMLMLWPWNKISNLGSPFVRVFDAIGIPAAASVINFIVIIASLSALNGALFLYTRMLYNLALQGRAPKYMTELSRRKLPVSATATMLVIMLVAVLVTAFVPEKAFTYFASLSVSGTILNWVIELVSELRFRRLRRREGTEGELKFKMPWWPWSNYIALAFMFFVLVMLALSPDTRITYVFMPAMVLVYYIIYRIVESRKKHQTSKSVSDAN